MPLFNKFSPLPEGELRSAIEAYARKRNFKLSGIFTMDSSKRSTKSNAFFTGFGKFRRLVFFDTLISKQTTEELIAVLAHEIGHFERKHIIKSMVLSIITTGIVFYTFALFLNNPDLFAAFKMESISVYASIVFVGFIYSPLLRFLSIFTQKLSRKHEFEADDFAVETYGRPELLISALKKLSVDNMSHLTPHPLKVILDYTHPPILERIKALQEQIKK
jgi:STE24 endopeptidase